MLGELEDIKLLEQPQDHAQDPAEFLFLQSE
jgi:hypothetical protein